MVQWCMRSGGGKAFTPCRRPNRDSGGGLITLRTHALSSRSLPALAPAMAHCSGRVAGAVRAVSAGRQHFSQHAAVRCHHQPAAAQVHHADRPGNHGVSGAGDGLERAHARAGQPDRVRLPCRPRACAHRAAAVVAARGAAAVAACVRPQCRGRNRRKGHPAAAARQPRLDAALRCDQQYQHPQCASGQVAHRRAWPRHGGLSQTAQGRAIGVVSFRSGLYRCGGQLRRRAGVQRRAIGRAVPVPPPLPRPGAGPAQARHHPCTPEAQRQHGGAEDRHRRAARGHQQRPLRRTRGGRYHPGKRRLEAG